MYDLVGSHFQVSPILINLTATLTAASIKVIMKHLALKKSDTFMVHRYPLGNKTHIIIFEKTIKFSITAVELFVKIRKDENNRMIIFCKGVEECGYIYRELSYVLGEEYRANLQVGKQSKLIGDYSFLSV